MEHNEFAMFLCYILNNYYYIVSYFIIHVQVILRFFCDDAAKTVKYCHNLNVEIKRFIKFHSVSIGQTTTEVNYTSTAKASERF